MGLEEDCGRVHGQDRGVIESHDRKRAPGRYEAEQREAGDIKEKERGLARLQHSGL